MSMLDAAREAAAGRLGGATLWRDSMMPGMPDFGALPDVSAMPAAAPAPAAPVQENPAMKRYAELRKAGQIDENGLGRDGKMFRGPQARLFVAQNGGRDHVLKDAKLAAELNRITIAENRALGGLEPLEQAPQQGGSLDLAAAFPRPEGMAEETYLYHLGNIGKGKDAGSEQYKDSFAALNSQDSERAQKIQAAKDKREKARQAKLKAMQLDFQFLPAAFDALKQSERILNDKGLLAAGRAAGWLPRGLDQDREDLKNYLNSIGAEELKKNVEALRSTSENGTLGMRLTQEEIMKEIQRAGPLTVDTSPETLLRTVRNLRNRLSHEVGLAARQLRQFDPKAYAEMGEWLQQGDPEIYQLYLDAAKDAAQTPAAAPATDVRGLSNEELLRQLGGM